MTDTQTDTNAVELATELTIAWLSNPNTRANANEVPEFLRTMHDAVNGLTGSENTETSAAGEQKEEFIPAVSVRKSLGSRDHIISLIDGRPYKSLRRHLSSNGLTPEQYRTRYGLKADYPMVAPAYADARREMAKKIGLGRKRKDDSAAPATVAERGQSRRRREGRRGAAAATDR